MSQDLIARLRSWPDSGRQSPARLCHEAATVIDQQSAEIERLREFVELAAAPLMIDGPDHSAIVRRARALIAALKGKP